MDIRKLAYEYGVQLAKAEFEKRAKSSYVLGEDRPEDVTRPWINRAVLTPTLASMGAGLGAGMGGGPGGLAGLLAGGTGGYLWGRHRDTAAQEQLQDILRHFHGYSTAKSE